MLLDTSEYSRVKVARSLRRLSDRLEYNQRLIGAWSRQSELNSVCAMYAM